MLELFLKLTPLKKTLNFFKVIERQNMQIQTIIELLTDDSKSKYFSNPIDILKSQTNL